MRARLPDTEGYVDHFVALDTVYTRRWSVRSLPESPADTLIVQVRVLTSRGGGARLTTARTRKGG